MNTAIARGIQTDIPSASRSPLFSPDDSTISLDPTPKSTTSPDPSTPQRGRHSIRYPDTLGRVPLHRRGTSKTYERLEDLLREAGYKETRVFTPETDRITGSTTEKDGFAGNGVKGSVGAVVDFIAGLVNRGSSLSHDVAPLEDDPAQSGHPWPPPPSPLAHALHIKNNRAKRVSSAASLARNDSSESVRRRLQVDLSADALDHTHMYQVTKLHQSSQGLPHHPRSYLRAHHRAHFNNRHHHHLNDDSSNAISTKPNPPNARAYLRHMASAPNIQPLAKRPSLSDAAPKSHALGRAHRNGTYPTFILNDEGSIAESDDEPHARDNGAQVHPPLPRNWIETVAKALLTVGGPVAVASDTASTRTAKTASTRKSSTLSDKSNQGGRGRVLARGTKTPLLCAQMQEVKARTSEGQVSCTRVMCRSTPTSRASSRVRSRTHEDRGNARNGGKRKQADRSRNCRRGQDRDVDVVPSLARTKAENDGWMAPRQRYTSSWGIEGSAQAYPDGTWSDDSDHDDDDDDEEGELGLDRLLVPARRQHSIQSLRKHLHRPSSQVLSAPGTRSPRSGRASPFGGAPSGRLEWGDASWSTSRSREWAAGRCEEDEDGCGHVPPGTKWRRGLPGLAQWTTSS